MRVRARSAIDRERLVGFLDRLAFVVVFERQPRQQFLRFDQLGIGFQRLLRQFTGLCFEILGGDQRQPEQRTGVIFLDLQRLVEQVRARRSC